MSMVELNNDNLDLDELIMDAHTTTCVFILGNNNLVARKQQKPAANF